MHTNSEITAARIQATGVIVAALIAKHDRQPEPHIVEAMLGSVMKSLQNIGLSKEEIIQEVQFRVGSFPLDDSSQKIEAIRMLRTMCRANGIELSLLETKEIVEGH